MEFAPRMERRAIARRRITRGRFPRRRIARENRTLRDFCWRERCVRCGCGRSREGWRRRCRRCGGGLRTSGNVILESNSVLKFLRPDLYMTVLDPGTEDFKKSAQEFMDRAEAVILHEGAGVGWQGVSLKPVAGRPVFRIAPPAYVTEEIVEFVRGVVEVGRSGFLTEPLARFGMTRRFCSQP